MKKLVLILAVLLGATITMTARDTYSRNVADLPAAAQSIIKQNFKADVSIIKIDRGFSGISEYEVILNDGTEITFDKSGNWKDVEVARGKKVPDYFVPKAILDYIKQYNQGKKVIGIEKKRNGYDIELENGIDMKFDRAGKFLRYDD